jgi:hypothetical protein
MTIPTAKLATATATPNALVIRLRIMTFPLVVDMAALLNRPGESP